MSMVPGGYRHGGNGNATRFGNARLRLLCELAVLAGGVHLGSGRRGETLFRICSFLHFFYDGTAARLMHLRGNHEIN